MTDIVEDRGAVRTGKGSPMVYVIMRKSHTQNEGPNSRNLKALSKEIITDRPTDQPTNLDRVT